MKRFIATFHTPALSSCRVAWCWFFAFTVVGLNFALQGHLGMNLADEGFLYYGALRVRAGEIPLADFQSYEPYRYYWCAAWMWFLGDSLSVVRGATATFGAIGVAFGLLAVARVIKSPVLLCLIAIAMVSSNVLWYRQFDMAAPLIAIWVGVKIAENATPRAAMGGGLLVGLIAGIGRNHGLYSAVGILVVLLAATSGASIKARLIVLGNYLAGIAIGYLPIMAHYVLVANYSAMLWDSAMARQLRTGTTNLWLPAPWPWTVPLSTLAWPDALRAFGIGVEFAAVPLTYALGASVLVRRGDYSDPASRLLLASVAVGVPYLHHAFSRADPAHLLEGSQAFVPAMAALLCMASRRVSWVATRAILVMVIIAQMMAVNVWHQPRVAIARAAAGSYVPLEANGSTVLAPRSLADTVTALRNFKASHLNRDETMLMAPHLPMAYALLQLRSPVWEIYFLWPRSERFQREEIRDLERRRVEFVVFADVKIDNRDDRRFSFQTPLLYRYLLENYAPFEMRQLPEPYRVYRRATPFPVMP